MPFDFSQINISSKLYKGWNNNYTGINMSPYSYTIRVGRLIGVFVLLVVLSACSTLPTSSELRKQAATTGDIESLVGERTFLLPANKKEVFTLGKYGASTLGPGPNWTWASAPIGNTYRINIGGTTLLDSTGLKYLRVEKRVLPDHVYRRLSRQSNSGAQYLLLSLDSEKAQFESELKTKSRENDELARDLKNPTFGIITSVVYIVNVGQYRTMRDSDNLLLNLDSANSGSVLSVSTGKSTVSIPDSQMVAYGTSYICNPDVGISLCDEPNEKGRAMLGMEKDRQADIPEADQQTKSASDAKENAKRVAKVLGGIAIFAVALVVFAAMGIAAVIGAM